MGKICCIDFDGTCCDMKYPEIGDPKPGVKEALTKIREMGFEIHIFSCRTNPEVTKYLIDRIQQVRLMEEFLDKYEIPYDKVLNENKPLARVYIDDRAIGYRGDWEKVIKEMKGM